METIAIALYTHRASPPLESRGVTPSAWQTARMKFLMLGLFTSVYTPGNRSVPHL